MNAGTLWEREVRAGVGGQDRQRPSTWHIDALYRAACCEANAREWDAVHRPTAAAWRAQGDAYLAEAIA